MNWSPFQREMLEAMGLAPYRMAGAATETASLPRGASERARDATARPTTAAALDPLLAALLRAAGLRADDAEAAVWAARWPSSQHLRGDARAKRALWPQLRALRRSPQ